MVVTGSKGLAWATCADSSADGVMAVNAAMAAMIFLVLMSVCLFVMVFGDGPVGGHDGLGFECGHRRRAGGLRCVGHCRRTRRGRRTIARAREWRERETGGSCWWCVHRPWSVEMPGDRLRDFLRLAVAVPGVPSQLRSCPENHGKDPIDAHVVECCF